MFVRVALTLMIYLVAVPCHAYVGPGLGAGVLAAIAGVIVSIVAAIFAITYYPIKRALKRKSEADESGEQKESGSKSSPDDPHRNEP